MIRADYSESLVGKRFDPDGRGIVVSKALSELYRDPAPDDEVSAAMRAALENIVECPPGEVPSPREVGNKLRQFRRRVFKGRKLEIAPGRQSAGVLWRMVKAGQG